jgi:UDP-N-acetylmuramyl pentapeptide phosphotransferase/UDP-N-acetylglucosamine-1-phosphate transferase
VLTSKSHGRYTMDLPGGFHKVHAVPTPRVGGLGIYLALWLAASFAQDSDTRSILQAILIAGMPALGVGLIEDVTKNAGISSRLVATGMSGVLAVWIGGVVVSRVDIPLADALLATPAIALVFTVFAMAGLSNALNIIDGFHGLATGAATIALLGIGAVAFAVGDTSLMLAALVVGAALAGFGVINFPWGKLFLGDGGAYFAGFALACLAVLLPARNAEVSPWASLLICGYPVIEALYSIARRGLDHRSPAQADRGHLHSLIATRVVAPRLRGFDPTLQNAAVSVVMWICAAIPAFVGVTLYAHTSWLALGAAGSLLLYHWLYRRVASA